MTPLAQVQPESAEGLLTFVDRLRTSNPFAVNRVDRLAAPRANVDSIHRAPYEKIIALAGQACADNRGVGAVLWGDAGAGKSHLLARLAGWAAGEHAVFVYLHNLLPNPEQLPRYVLKSVVSYLTHGLIGAAINSPLFRMINAAVRTAVQHDQVSPVNWRSAEMAYTRLILRLASEDATGAVLLDRDVYRVLFLFFRALHPKRPEADAGLHRLAARWLSGDALDPDEARQLGLRGDEEGARLADDQQVTQVLVALTQLARSRGQPFLLCFDQVDNLGQERVAALAQFLHALLDNAGNLLVVFCGTQQTLRDYQQAHVIHEAAWHRLAQYRLDLLPISREEARHILENRLAVFLEPLAHLPEIKERLSEDSLFPLGRAWFDERLSKAAGIQPRRVIDWARERWEEQQARLGAEPISAWLSTWSRTSATAAAPPREESVDRLVSQKIAELTARRKQEPHRLPASAENLAGLVATLLEQTGRVTLDRPPPLKTMKTPPYDFAVRKTAAAGNGKAADTAVLFVGTDSATSMTAALRRLLKGTPAGKTERVLLVTEERQPLKLGGRGQELLEKLTARPAPAFSRLTLTFQQYAELDALQAIVGLARSGDLEVDGRTVSEAEVVASHHRRGRYLAHVLLRELLEGSAAPSASAALLDEKDLREFLTGRLAATSGCSSRQMALFYAENRAAKGAAPLPEDVLLTAVEAIAQKLDADGLIAATPGPAGLDLLSK